MLFGKEGKTIALYNNKGGVGKTTLASAIVAMAVEDNRRVNVIDADKQRNLMKLVSGNDWTGEESIENGLITAHTTLNGYEEGDLNIIDCPPQFEFIESMGEIPVDLWIIPIRGRFSIDGAANVVNQLKENGREKEEIMLVSNMNSRQGKYGRVQFNEAKKIGTELYPYPIHSSIVFQRAEDAFKFVFDMPYASRSESVAVLKKLCREILN